MIERRFRSPRANQRSSYLNPVVAGQDRNEQSQTHPDDRRRSDVLHFLYLLLSLCLFNRLSVCFLVLCVFVPVRLSSSLFLFAATELLTMNRHTWLTPDTQTQLHFEQWWKKTPFNLLFWPFAEKKGRTKKQQQRFMSDCQECEFNTMVTFRLQFVFLWARYIFADVVFPVFSSFPITSSWVCERPTVRQLRQQRKWRFRYPRNRLKLRMNRHR